MQPSVCERKFTPLRGECQESPEDDFPEVPQKADLWCLFVKKGVQIQGTLCHSESPRWPLIQKQDGQDYHADALLSNEKSNLTSDHAPAPHGTIRSLHRFNTQPLTLQMLKKPPQAPLSVGFSHKRRHAQWFLGSPSDTGLEASLFFGPLSANSFPKRLLFLGNSRFKL